MPNGTTEVRRIRKSPFVLDKAKLSRILDILEQRFLEAELAFKPTFEITHKKGRKIKTNGIDEVFALDNSIGNPITELIVDAEGHGSEGTLFCRLDFDNTTKPYIIIEVASLNSQRANRAFAELEEQVERTLTNSWMYKLNASTLFPWAAGLLILMFFAALFFLPSEGDINKNAFYQLSKDEINSFTQQARTVVTTEDKINFLFALQSRQLDQVAKQPTGVVIGRQDIANLFTLKSLFVLLPVILIIGCFVYLRKKSYPNAVFMWGDWEEHFSKLLSMRKTIWTVIIAAFIVGVLSNLFVYGLSLR